MVRNDDRNFSSTSFDSYSKSGPPGPPGPPCPPDHLSNEGYTKLVVIAAPTVNQDQLWKLFDVVPGTFLITFFSNKLHKLIFITRYGLLPIEIRR